MRNYYIINIVLSAFLFLASMGIMVCTFTLANPSAEIFGFMCCMFTLGMLGSYGYYSNARDWKAKINNK